MSEKRFYIIDWDKLVHVYNQNNIAQITQTRIAKAYSVTTATISLSKTRPMSMNNVNTYRPIYDMIFKKTIEFDELLIETKKNDKFK